MAIETGGVDELSAAKLMSSPPGPLFKLVCRFDWEQSDILTASVVDALAAAYGDIAELRPQPVD